MVVVAEVVALQRGRGADTAIAEDLSTRFVLLLFHGSFSSLYSFLGGYPPPPIFLSSPKSATYGTPPGDWQVAICDCRFGGSFAVESVLRGERTSLTEQILFVKY